MEIHVLLSELRRMIGVFFLIIYYSEDPLKLGRSITIQKPVLVTYVYVLMRAQ